MIDENVTETIQDSNSYLTNFVQREKVHNPIGDFIAPPFKVRLEAGKYLRYTEDIHRVWDNRITGRQEALEIQWDAEEESYDCKEYGMAKFVSDKAKRQAIKPIKLEQEAGKRLKHYQSKARDWRVWQVAGSTAIVPNGNVGAAWNTAAGTPVTDIITAMAAVEAARGVLPNKILIPTQVALRMTLTTEWRQYFMLAGNYQHAENGAFGIMDALRKIGLEPMVTSTRGLRTYKCTGSDPASESLISDSVLLFYSEPNPSTDCMTFMFSPFVQKDRIYRTRKPRKRGVYIDIDEDVDELLVENDCGYILENCI